MKNISLATVFEKTETSISPGSRTFVTLEVVYKLLLPISATSSIHPSCARSATDIGYHRSPSVSVIDQVKQLSSVWLLRVLLQAAHKSCSLSHFTSLSVNFACHYGMLYTKFSSYVPKKF